MGSPVRESTLRAIALAIRTHARKGIHEIRLERTAGRSSYQPTGEVWVNNQEDELFDDSGDAMLVGGQTPEQLADSILEAADECTTEDGVIKAYRAVGISFQEKKKRGRKPKVPDDESPELVELVLFTTLLPKKCFSLAGGGPNGRTRDDLVVASWRALLDQNKMLAASNNKLADLIPTAVERINGVMLAQPHPPPGESKADILRVILEHDRETQQRYWEYRNAEQRAQHKFKLAQDGLDIAAPGLEILFAKLACSMFGEEDEGPPTPGPDGKTRCRSSSVLYRAASRLKDDEVEAIKDLFSQKEWDLLTRLQECETEDHFAAVTNALQAEMRRSRTRADVLELLAKIEKINARFVHALATLLQRAERSR